MTARRLLLLTLLLAAAVAASGQVVITSTSPLPQGFSEIAYTYTFTAVSSPTGPINWSLANVPNNTLPSGFTLSQNGTLSGTTQQFGTFTFQVTATLAASVPAASPFSATQTFSLTLLNPFITINSPPFLPSGFIGQSYSYVFQGISNPSGLVWTVGGGTALPPGLTLSPSGVLSGNPTTAGTYPFTVNVQIGGTKFSTNDTFSVTVYAGQATIQTTALPFAFSGQSYSFVLNGNPSTVTWMLTGMLPPGITFNQNTGALAGATTALGAYPLQFQANFPNYLSTTRSLILYVTGGPLSVPQTTLKPAVQGSAYQTTVVGAGGLAPYQWGLAVANTLNLSINAQTGVLSGTPQASGSFLVPITLSDATGQSIQVNLSIFVASPLTVATTTLPNGFLNVAYSQAILPGGGVSPFTWALASGSAPLPPGLSMSSSGVITGAPTASGTFHFTVQVADAGGRTATGQLSISVGVTAISITTAAFPNGQITVPYSQALAASGGVAPYKWTVVSGSLPPGLSLNTNGTLSGTPSGQLGISSFTVQVTDSSPPPALTAQKAFTINIALTLTITTQGLPGGTVNVAYSQTLVGSGGTSPYIWSISSGTLPPGLQLNPSSGIIAGTPTATGPSLFTVTLTDATGLTATQQLNILVAPRGGAPSITTGNLTAVVGVAFSQTLAATGGTSPYSWSIASGTLPAGLQLNNGVISGTPTAAGVANITLTVTDAQQQTATEAISITVLAPPSVNIGTISGNAAAQTAVGLNLASAFPVDLTGTLSVAFQSAAGGNPTEVHFITPAGTSSAVSFSIPAGTTKAVFSNAPVLATGTVAGTITLTAALSANGSNIPLTPVPTETIVIAPVAPVIQSVEFSNTGGSLSVIVIGYSTTREVVSGQFTFAPTTGSTLSQNSVTVQLGSAFSTWYQSSASNQSGGQFMLTIPFSVSGTSADVASVSVTLTNTKGVSVAVSPQ